MMTKEQGREGSDKGFRTDTLCQTNDTPTPISNSEWMVKTETQNPNQTDQVQSDAIQSLRDRFPNIGGEFRPSGLKAITRPIYHEYF